MNDNVPHTSTVRTLWGWLTGSGRPPAEDGKSLAAADLRSARATLREMLAGIGGEASARRRVQLLAQLYRGANDAGRCAFLKLMATDFGPEPVAVARAVEAYLGASLTERPRAEAALRIALGSPRIRILKQFNLLGDGVKFLVDLRGDVLRFVRAAPELEAIDEELLSLLASWFDIGNLELSRISWQSSAALLEKLIAYEAVHEIRSWTDLRNRLDMDRRCYAFFHPRMPEEPLIFVELALVKEMASNIHALLDETAPAMDPHAAQAAIFYSISNTQPGLRGVSFGTFLVKRVVQQLALDFPKLKTFATLSPAPGLRKWLEARLTEKDPSVLDKQEAAKLAHAARADDAFEAMQRLLTRDLANDTVAAAALQPVLCQLTARYLVQEKEDSAAEVPRPLDPVARFHLGNGARLERINWLADTSPRGLKQSAGVMVNYLYKLADIEDNHEAYARDGRVALSDGVKRLLRKPA